MAAPNIVTGSLPQEQEYMLTLPVSNLANIGANETLKVAIQHPFKILDIRWRTGEIAPASSGTASITFTPLLYGSSMTAGTITVTNASHATCGASAVLSTAITGGNTGTHGQGVWIRATSVTTSSDAFTAGNGWFEIDVINTAVGANYPSTYSIGQ